MSLVFCAVSPPPLSSRASRGLPKMHDACVGQAAILIHRKWFTVPEWRKEWDSMTCIFQQFPHQDGSQPGMSVAYWWNLQSQASACRSMFAAMTATWAALAKDRTSKLPAISAKLSQLARLALAAALVEQVRKCRDLERSSMRSSAGTGVQCKGLSDCKIFSPRTRVG